MKAKVLSKEGLEYSILLNGFSVTLANALRRAIIREVPTATIEDVVIHKNTSRMYDEVLAQRLGLIPLKVTKNKDEFSFKLVAKGERNVYSGDIQFEDGVQPVYDKMLLVKLNEGEELDIEGKIKFGIGEDHAKFIPAHVTYRFKPKVKIEKQPENPKKVVEVCPAHVFDIESGKLVVKNEDACILCMACVDTAGEEYIKVIGDENNIIMDIESWGSLEVKDIFNKAIDSLESELATLKKAL